MRGDGAREDRWARHLGVHAKRRCFRQYGTLGAVVVPLASLERHLKSDTEGTGEELML